MVCSFSAFLIPSCLCAPVLAVNRHLPQAAVACPALEAGRWVCKDASALWWIFFFFFKMYLIYFISKHVPR